MAVEDVELLLVDDSADDIAFVRHALHQAGLTPRMLTANDGAQALELLFGKGDPASSPPRFRPQVIVLDLKLPKVDGIEVLRRLKSNRHTRAIPVVIWSSSIEKRDLVTSYQLGVNSYLVKPMDAEEFSASVRALISYWLRFNRPHPRTSHE
jgi:CheY-like chemotaxis protein